MEVDIYNNQLMQAFAGGMYSYSCRLNEPFTLYRPKLFIDGNQWCALYGDNLQDGVAGFGNSPEKAVEDFNRQWSECLQSAERKGKEGDQ